MAGPRRRRQQTHEGEDTFVALILRFGNWAQNNVRALILLGVAASILIAGILYYVDYRQRVSEAASTEIRSIRMELQSGGSREGIVQQLRSFIQRFGDTPYGDDGRVLLAQALLLQGRAEEAIQPARSTAENLGDQPLATRAAFLLAAAYEETGDTARAIDTYERIGEEAGFKTERMRGLEAAARLRAAFGDRQGALALYERLVELTPEDDPQRGFYEMRAAELRAETTS